jgi:hypothetical protein
MGESVDGTPLMPVPLVPTQLHLPSPLDLLDSPSIYDNSLFDLNFPGFDASTNLEAELDFSVFDTIVSEHTSHPSTINLMHAYTNAPPSSTPPIVSSTVNPASLMLSGNNVLHDAKSTDTSSILLTANPASLMSSGNKVLHDATSNGPSVNPAVHTPLMPTVSDIPYHANPSGPSSLVNEVFLPPDLNFGPSAMFPPYFVTSSHGHMMPASISTYLPVAPSGDHTNQTPLPAAPHANQTPLPAAPSRDHTNQAPLPAAPSGDHPNQTPLPAAPSGDHTNQTPKLTDKVKQVANQGKARSMVERKSNGKRSGSDENNPCEESGGHGRGGSRGRGRGEARPCKRARGA